VTPGVVRLAEPGLPIHEKGRTPPRPGLRNSGTHNVDTIKACAGADTIRGRGGSICSAVSCRGDRIYAGDGNDWGDGGRGVDDMWGGFHNDTLLGGGHNDTIHGQEGADTVRGEDGDDYLVGGPFDDRVFGRDKSDTVFPDNVSPNGALTTLGPVPATTRSRWRPRARPTTSTAVPATTLWI
jgi:Ca2+-binding RTX toxin-like protein